MRRSEATGPFTAAAGPPAVWLPAIALCLGWSTAAAAQETSLSATGDLTVAYDDNIQGAPDSSDAASVLGEPIADVVIGMQPGLLFKYATPRTKLSAAYRRSFFFYADHPEADSSADGASLGVARELSDVDELAMVLGASRAPSNLTILGGPSDATTGAQRATPLQLLTVTLDEGYKHSFSELWEVSQSLGFATTQPLLSAEDEAGPDSVGALYGLATSIAASLNWREHSLSADSNAQLVNTEVPDQTYVIPGLGLTWRWNFALLWSSELRAGLAAPFDFEGNVRAVPVGAVAVHYQDEGFGASLVLSRSFSSNPALQQVFYSDAASLSGSLPLWREAGLGVDGSVGIAINRLVDDRVEVDSERATNFVADVGLVWRSPTLPLALSARYQRYQQFDSTNEAVIANVTRNLFGAAFTYLWPPPDLKRPRVYRRRGAPAFQFSE